MIKVISDFNFGVLWFASKRLQTRSFFIRSYIDFCSVVILRHRTIFRWSVNFLEHIFWIAPSWLFHVSFDLEKWWLLSLSLLAVIKLILVVASKDGVFIKVVVKLACASTDSEVVDIRVFLFCCRVRWRTTRFDWAISIDKDRWPIRLKPCHFKAECED